MPYKKTRKPRRILREAPAESNVEDYRHEQAKRVNNPPAALASYDKAKPHKPKQSYPYDPHLSPQLVWAGKAGLKAIEIEERACLQVDTVPLYIHERVSTQAIVRAVTRPEVKQLALFADRSVPLHEAVEFYQHEMDWANRLILGDSLLVMNSLLQRERMAGKVQMIYMDPPYGVKFSSNFQPRIDRRDVKDDDESLTREPEQIQAYRDTWQLGVHSYLTYLRDRLLLCRDLLADTGSIFVQISDENLHRVRLLMDEVFGTENFLSQIVFRKTTGKGSAFLDTTYDSLLWYARDRGETTYRQMYLHRLFEDDENLRWVELPNGTRRQMNKEEITNPKGLPHGARIFRPNPLTSQSASTTTLFEYEFEGRMFKPGKGGWKTNIDGMRRLETAGRLMVIGNTLCFIRYLDDFPYKPTNDIWDDTRTSGYGDPKVYVVQTAARVIERCILMSTKPGDLVLDPTCGSGTTAYVAEQWGRRWITCDTSRVALALARQRLLTATFPYYKLADNTRGVPSGFIYKKVPHITLKSIAQNEPPETATLYDQPEVDNKKVRVSGPFTVEAIAPTPEEPEQRQSGLDSASKQNAGEHIASLINLLQKDGVTFPNNKKMIFASLTPLRGGILHAAGDSQNGQVTRVAVSFGPQHGPVTARQVEEGMREANLGGYGAIVFCGFAFDGDAQTIIQRDPHPNVRAFMAHIRPDVMMDDLLKTTATSQLFTVFGEPDIAVKRKGAKFVITLRGVDVYNPLVGQVTSARAEQIAAWFLDTDYDGRTFCIVQAFFPNQSAWDKLQRALKGSLDEDAFEQLTGTESLPFIAGENGRAAVKVIDHRGNEVMKVVELT